MIEESWKAAFRFLAEKDIKNLTIRDIENWASSKVHVLNEHSSKLFNQMDPQNKGVIFFLCKFIEFQSFREFVLNSGYNDIVASVGNEKVIVPLNLTSLYLNS